MDEHEREQRLNAALTDAFQQPDRPTREPVDTPAPTFGDGPVPDGFLRWVEQALDILNKRGALDALRDNPRSAQQ